MINPLDKLRPGFPITPHFLNEVSDAARLLHYVTAAPPLGCAVLPTGVHFWFDVAAPGTFNGGTSGSAGTSPPGILNLPTETVKGPPTWTPLAGTYPEVWDPTLGLLWLWDGSNWVALGGGLDVHAYHHTGRWYSWYLGSIVSGSSISGFNDILRAGPFLTTTSVTLQNIGAMISNNDVSNAHNVRFGIYTNTSYSSVYPNSRLYDSGNVSITANTPTTQAYSTACAITLAPGLYWLVITADDSQIGVDAIVIPSASPSLVYGLLGSTAITTARARGSWFVTSTFGALPATFPAIGGATMDDFTAALKVQIA